MKKADTLDELAAKCGIDPAGLRATVERFNTFAETGKDLDFKRGERAYDRYFADPTHGPNPSLGAISSPPYYAVEMFPGDVGTYGGLVADEFGRVLDKSGAVIEGLYATGNCTAGVTGACYPGAGASIAASFIFGYRAARHACGIADPI
jgi:3-oxosteroid 1-dehydrogenase